MGYSTGMLNKRVKVAKRYVGPDNADNFGKSGQPKYEWVNPNGDHAFWCGVTFDKGMKSLREGALDSYITKMFRFRCHDNMDEWCLLQYRGKWFQIHSFNDDFQDNTIQITAVSMANQQVTIVDPPTPTYKDIEIWGNSECTVRPSGNPLYVYAQFNSEIRADLTLSNGDYKISVSFNRTFRTVCFDEEWQQNEYNAGQTIPAGTLIQLTSNERVPSQLTKTNFSFEIV